MFYRAVLGIVIVLVLGCAYYWLQPDTYHGFFYPNANDLSVDIMSDREFRSVSDCRIWAETTALEYAEIVLSHENGWDYECGLNCKVTGSKPYICEETVR